MVQQLTAIHGGENEVTTSLKNGQVQLRHFCWNFRIEKLLFGGTKAMHETGLVLSFW